MIYVKILDDIEYQHHVSLNVYKAAYHVTLNIWDILETSFS